MEEEVVKIDWRLWGLFGLASISLIWNFTNSISVRRVDAKNKTRAIKLEEFRYSVRGPINAALATLTECGNCIQAISVSDTSLKDNMDASGVINRDTVKALNTLYDCLQEANDSDFSADSNWLEVHSKYEDRILAQFDLGLNVIRDDSIRRNAFSKAKDEIISYKARIVRKVSDELLEYAK